MSSWAWWWKQLFYFLGSCRLGQSGWSSKLCPRKLAVMGVFSVSVNGILGLLLNLKPGNAAGPDLTDLSPFFSKEPREEIAPTIRVLIFERSIKTGELPADWCKAQATPRKGINRLQPIASLFEAISPACMLMQGWLHTWLKAPWLTWPSVRPTAWLCGGGGGGRGGRVMRDTANHVGRGLAVNISAGKPTDLVLLEFFGGLWWSVTPGSFGVSASVESDEPHYSGSVLSLGLVMGGGSWWRRIRLVISSVPRGSVLGPILFLVYIDDLSLRMRRFADDAVVCLAVGGAEGGGAAGGSRWAVYVGGAVRRSSIYFLLYIDWCFHQYHVQTFTMGWVFAWQNQQWNMPPAKTQIRGSWMILWKTIDIKLVRTERLLGSL